MSDVNVDRLNRAFGIMPEYEADPDVLDYIQGNRPWQTHGKIELTARRCDVCYNEDPGKTIQIKSDKRPAVLTVCMGNCLELALPADMVKKLRFQASIQQKMPDEKSDLPSGHSTMLQVSGLSGEDQKVITDARAYRNAGFGKQWKSARGILTFVKDHGKLSERQLATLRKYNESCKREMGDD